ncbi:CBS and ACT domain-containing protein [Spirochaeta thermophila]|uniref:CBS domain containing membrane protein n=2 Tax=Winmispira thermophila TaxID=154 RepID=G0GDS6_WINT7|nr:CBS domain-containing protein [Spirochaeta thermophila]ADN02837.1 CBS domain containing protein [Spirochaeta thermophila DSM 6192]AEJ62206.1 CBS domain containing membrane protein [Spirochaeta thermophila DSM 6578]
MKVAQVMTHNPVTVTPATTLSDAQELMRREKIHRLPVIDEKGRVVGIVSEKDLLYASPSPATTLNVYEMAQLLSKVRIKEVMRTPVITVTEDTYIEDAARIMVDNNIGGLPVVRGEKLVGIITESDIFKRFVELFGTRKKGVRLTLLIPERRGEIADIASAIARAGGNIVSLGTFLGEDPTSALFIVKVEGLSKEEACSIVEPLVEKVVDAAMV